MCDFAAQAAEIVEELEERGVVAFEVSEAAESDWCGKILATRVDPTPVMALCTPSRMNNEGDPAAISPLASNYGPGMGDFFGYTQVLADWWARGDLEGLELET